MNLSTMLILIACVAPFSILAAIILHRRDQREKLRLENYEEWSRLEENRSMRREAWAAFWPWVMFAVLAAWFFSHHFTIIVH